jgi:TonB family protein
VKVSRSILLALALRSALPQAFAADPSLTWKIEGDEVPADSKSHLDVCLGVAKQMVPAAGQRPRVSVGIYVDRTGRVTDVAVVEPSGSKELDDWVRGCFRGTRFKPPDKGNAASYRLVSLDLSRKPFEPPAQCVAGMHADETITVRPLAQVSEEEMPTGSEATVCGCLTDIAQGPTPPVILSSSNAGRVDEGAIELMKKTAAERWRVPFGCTAWKVQIVR